MTTDFKTDGGLKGEMKPAGPVWTRNLPTESGVYWWWNEDDDCAPLHLEIMYSGSDGSYFAPAGQYQWTEFQPVARLGGWWMRLYEPETPTLALRNSLPRAECFSEK